MTKTMMTLALLVVVAAFFLTGWVNECRKLDEERRAISGPVFCGCRTRAGGVCGQLDNSTEQRGPSIIHRVPPPEEQPA